MAKMYNEWIEDLLEPEMEEKQIAGLSFPSELECIDDIYYEKIANLVLT